MNGDGLPIGIVAHHSREQMARELGERVRAQVISIDPGDDTDKGMRIVRCAENHRAVLNQLYELSGKTGRDWCIVLEDDALPVGDFRRHAAAALDYAPSSLIGFFIGVAGANRNREKLDQALGDGIAWCYANHMVSAVAYAIRADLIPAITQTFKAEPHITTEAYITKWAQKRSVWFHYTLPSIVDHRIHQSIIFKSQKGPGRGAWKVGVPERWDTRTVAYDP